MTPRERFDLTFKAGLCTYHTSGFMSRHVIAANQESGDMQITITLPRFVSTIIWWFLRKRYS